MVLITCIIPYNIVNRVNCIMFNMFEVLLTKARVTMKRKSSRTTPRLSILLLYAEIYFDA